MTTEQLSTAIALQKSINDLQAHIDKVSQIRKNQENWF